MILADGNHGARQITRRGEGIYNDASGRIEGNKPFQAPLYSDSDFEKCMAAIRLDAVETPGTSNKMLQPTSDGSLVAAQESTAPAITDSLEHVPLPNGYRWIPLSQIDLAHELSGVASPNDFQKVDYVTMRRGLETFRSEILPALNANSGKNFWDLNAMFRDRDMASGKSYEYGVQRAFEAFFTQDDAIYLNRGRDEEQFRIINGRHRIKAALDAGWTAIPARTKDLRNEPSTQEIYRVTGKRRSVLAGSPRGVERLCCVAIRA